MGTEKTTKNEIWCFEKCQIHYVAVCVVHIFMKISVRGVTAVESLVYFNEVVLCACKYYNNTHL